MTKSKQEYTRRAFMVLGGTAVGSATLTGTAQAGGSHPKIHNAIRALKERVNIWRTPNMTSVVTRRMR